MSQRKATPASWIMLLAVAVAFVAVLVGLLSKRFSSADHYPDYSSLRSDPRGTRALYEALGRMPGMTVERNFQPLKKLSGAPGKVLLITSMSNRDFERPFVIDSPAIGRFAADGGRVVIAISPDFGENRFERATREARDESIQEWIEKDRKKQEKKKEAQPPTVALFQPVADKEAADEDDQELSEEEIEEIEEELEKKGRKWSDQPPLAAMLKTAVEGTSFTLTDKGGGAVTPELVLGLKPEDMPLWYSNLYLDDTHTVDFRKLWLMEFADRVADMQEDADRRDGIMRPGRGRSTPRKERKDFKQLRKEASPWATLATRAGRVVVAERQLGGGSVVLASDRYFLSNEALWKEPKAAFLSSLLGEGRHVIFEETSIGSIRPDTDGIMSLARRYNMHGLFLGGVLFFGLYIWRNASTLVPRDDRRDLGIWRQGAVAGQSSASGMEGMIRRGVKVKDLLALCFKTWRNTPGAARGVAEGKVHQAELAMQEATAERGNRHFPALYARIAGILGKR
jgi:hypothetical protein